MTGGQLAFQICSTLVHIALVWWMACNADRAITAGQQGWSITFITLTIGNALLVLYGIVRLYLEVA